MNKEDRVEKILEKLKKILNHSLQNGNLERAMASVAVGCQILYEFNQRYVDYDFEEGVVGIADAFKSFFHTISPDFRKDKNTILFYDGFGLDTRGVAKMYLNAIKKNGYKIIYVTGTASKGHMPTTDDILKDADSEIFYIDFKTSYTKWVNELLDVISSTKPKAMFYYTTPYDVSGAVAFATMEGLVDRFLIDLTDHAFWLGVRCNDYFCGSREMSASNQVYERGITREKIIKLGVNLIIDEDGSDHSGLPFDVEKERYIFSGGALYKTLGDVNNCFYRIIDYILSRHEDVFFLYAGDGDKTEMNKILQKYPDRAFLISERKDFYYLIKKCIFYLNTYPMFGGMMMKYSAYAGKLPITLKHEKDSDGLLLDQESRKIEYESYEELVEDVDRLLMDAGYLKDREAALQGSVISEERFIKNVKLTIEKHCTDYQHGNEHIDTSKFKKEYYERFKLNQAKEKVARLINRSLYIPFVWMPFDLLKRKIVTLVEK